MLVKPVTSCAPSDRRRQCSGHHPLPRRLASLSLILIVALFLHACLALAQTDPPPKDSPTITSIAQLQDALAGQIHTLRSLRLAGAVRAVAPQRRLVALEDASAPVLLELPSLPPGLRPGDGLTLDADNCQLVRSRFGVQVGLAPTADDDGIHSAITRSGSAFLTAGLNPIHLEWFNARGEMALTLEFEGPDTPRQIIPASKLFHNSPANATLPGLTYSALEKTNLRALTDLASLTPVAQGTATNFTIACRSRDENCGLLFNGLVQIEHPGIYTFYLTSDDGARLCAGKPSLACRIVPPPNSPLPPPESYDRALAAPGDRHWLETDGEVAFASENHASLELDLLVGGRHLPVTIIDAQSLFHTNLLHHWIRLRGLCEFSRAGDDKKVIGIFVPSTAEIQIRDAEENLAGLSTTNLLTTAAQVRRLKPDEAARHLPARLRGVVIYSSATALVLQDSSGGVFVSASGGAWPERPGFGELWQVTGVTDPGDFSPVIVANDAKFLGSAALPDPIQPTRDQLMNGNLDAEYAEIHGVLTSLSSTGMDLLTPEGKITVLGADDRPLPQLPAPAAGASLLGSVIRIRGCVATLVDLQTHQVIPAKIYLYPALAEIEDPPPADPFRLPLRKASDLMWFNARASALQRTKLAGQIIYASPGEYFVLDGGTGFRVLTDHTPPCQVGDLIEAVGFPRLGGPSPVLQAAQARPVGHSRLPAPVVISASGLLDRNRDATLIQVDASLISESVHQDEQILELQDGPRHFVARLKLDRRPTPLRVGCRLQLTGVYASADEEQNRVGENAAPFQLLLNNPAAIVVLQEPSWWTLQRAVIAMSVLAGSLAVTFIWVAQLRRKVEERTAQLKREIEERRVIEQRHVIEQERIRMAQDLHDELGSGLTEVGMLGSLANTPTIAADTKQRYLDQLTQVARSLVTSLDEIVWAVNPHYDSAASLTSYFSLFAESFLKLAGIACRFRVAQEIPHYPLDSKVRHELFCAFKEALNNVIRHSCATEVRLVFEIADAQLILCVIDNGTGFESVAEAPGKDGLASLARRLERLGGHCRITSQPGRGTQVEFRLPLNTLPNGQNRNC